MECFTGKDRHRHDSYSEDNSDREMDISSPSELKHEMHIGSMYRPFDAETLSTPATSIPGTPKTPRAFTNRQNTKDLDISWPFNPQHVDHIGFDPDKGTNCAAGQMLMDLKTKQNHQTQNPIYCFNASYGRFLQFSHECKEANEQYGWDNIIHTIRQGTHTERNIRLMTLGDIGVGKQSLVQLLTENSFDNLQMINNCELMTTSLMIDLHSKKRKIIGSGKEKTLSLHKLGHAIHSQMKTRCNQSAAIRGVTAECRKVIEEALLIYENDPSEKAYVSVWNFLRQQTLKATYHLFLDADAVYMVVYDLSKCLEDESHLDSTVEWMQSIVTNCDYPGSKIPPVLLIGTHLDKLHGSKTEQIWKANELQDKIFKQAVKNNLNFPFIMSFFIDNIQPQPELLSEIWDAILKAAPWQLQWGCQIPFKWLLLQHKLMDLRAKGQHYLTLKEICKVNNDCNLKLQDDDEILKFLDFLHQLGYILFIRLEPNSSISHMIILNTAWILKAFQVIITPPISPNQSKQIEWHHCAISATVTFHYMIRTWLNIRFHEAEILIWCLEALGLIAKFFNADLFSDFVKYIVPCMLKQPDLKWFSDNLRQNQSCRLSATYVIDFQDKKVPFQIYDRLLARFLSKYLPVRLHDGRTLARGFGFFRIPKTYLGFILHCKHSAIKLTLFSVEGYFQQGMGSEIRERLEYSLKTIIKSSGLTHLLSYSTCLHCRYKVDLTDKYVPITDILSERQLCCDLDVSIHFLDRELTDPWFSREEIRAEMHRHKNVSVPKTDGLVRSTTRTNVKRWADGDREEIPHADEHCIRDHRRHNECSEQLGAERNSSYEDTEYVTLYDTRHRQRIPPKREERCIYASLPFFNNDTRDSQRHIRHGQMPEGAESSGLNDDRQHLSPHNRKLNFPRQYEQQSPQEFHLQRMIRNKQINQFNIITGNKCAVVGSQATVVQNIGEGLQSEEQSDDE